MGHGKVQDHMFLDGLEDAYDKGTLMGHFAEETARTYQFTREQQDEFAITSLTRAKTAIEDGSFDGEVTPVTVKHRKGETVVAQDEQPLTADFDKIPTLRPAFAQDGSVTAANSSSISDGGAALVLMRRSEAEARGLTPIALIHGHATHAQAPAWFTTAPGPALRKLFEKVGWDADDVDLFEINEAFAVVTMAAMRDLDLPHEKVNVHGGGLRARPSGRRLRRTHRHHAPGGAGEVRPRQGRGSALHRRWRGYGTRRRAPPLGRLP